MAKSNSKSTAATVLDARAERVLIVDLKGVRSKKALLEALADGLKLPKHFGHNWDALDDCINDDPFGKAASTTIVLLNAGNAETRLGEHWITFLEILEESAASWSAMDRSLRIVLA